MAINYEKEIICPYCGYKFQDSWEFNDEDGKEQEVDCPECDKEFTMWTEVEITYSTRKMGCNDGHEYGDPEKVIYDQALCDRWNAERFGHRSDWKPHVIWKWQCKNCEHVVRIKTGINAECPEVGR